MTTALTETERVKLGDMELIIEKGLKTFVEVGAALSIIREQRLYRASHDTFEAYCQERWGWSASRARQLIGAHEVVESVTAGNALPPETERQARALVDVPAEQRATVLTEAREEAKAEGKRVTAERIRDTAHRYTPTSQRKPRVPKVSKADQLRQMREKEAERREAERERADKGEPVSESEGTPTSESCAMDAEPVSPDPKATASLPGTAVLFVRSIVLPDADAVGGMTEADVAKVRETQTWCARVLTEYQRRKVHVA